MKKLICALLAAAALLSLTGCGNLRRDMFLPREEQSSMVAYSSAPASSVNADTVSE